MPPISWQANKPLQQKVNDSVNQQIPRLCQKTKYQDKRRKENKKILKLSLAIYFIKDVFQFARMNNCEKIENLS